MMSKEQRDKISAYLATLEDDNDRLTPDAVIEDAKNPASPLHPFFEWDLGKAAYRHWQEQARALISSVRIIQRTDKSVVSSVYYVRDPTASNDQQGYVSVKMLRTDEGMAREALVAEFSRVADLLRRARELAVALEMEDDVQELMDSVVRLRQIAMGETAKG